MSEGGTTAFGAGMVCALLLFAGAASLYIVGRGPGLSIALESALKLKETSGLHAEALSAAELLHGPPIRKRCPMRDARSRSRSQTPYGTADLVASSGVVYDEVGGRRLIGS